MSFVDVTRQHSRTLGGITSRLRGIACAMVDKGKTVEEAATATRLSADNVNDALVRRQKKKEERNVVQTRTSEETSSKALLKEIRDILMRIEAKL